MPRGPVVISSRSATRRHLKAGHAFRTVVSICDVDGPDTRPPWHVKRYKGPLLVLHFDDVEDPDSQRARREGYVPPDEASIRLLVAFADRHPAGPHLVHCSAGISRSSAAALIIQHHLTCCPASETLRVLDSSIHHPNLLMLRHYDKMTGAGLENVAAWWSSKNKAPW